MEQWTNTAMHKPNHQSLKPFSLILKNHAFINLFSIVICLGFIGFPVLGHTATVGAGWQDISSQVSISKTLTKTKKHKDKQHKEKQNKDTKPDKKGARFRVQITHTGSTDLDGPFRLVITDFDNGVDQHGKKNKNTKKDHQRDKRP
jgi:hypothetical protein